MKPWLARSIAEEPGSTVVQVGVGVGLDVLVDVRVPDPVLVPHPTTSNPRLVNSRTDNKRVAHALVIVVISHRRLSMDTRATQTIIDLVATKHLCDIATTLTSRRSHILVSVCYSQVTLRDSQPARAEARQRREARGSGKWWEAQPGNATTCGILEDVRAAR